jgi:hypothetical protein
MKVISETDSQATVNDLGFKNNLNLTSRQMNPVPYQVIRKQGRALQCAEDTESM